MNLHLSKVYFEIFCIQDYLRDNEMTEEEKNNYESWSKLRLSRLEQLETCQNKIEELTNQNLSHKREIDR